MHENISVRECLNRGAGPRLYWRRAGDGMTGEAPRVMNRQCCALWTSADWLPSCLRPPAYPFLPLAMCVAGQSVACHHWECASSSNVLHHNMNCNVAGNDQGNECKADCLVPTPLCLKSIACCSVLHLTHQYLLTLVIINRAIYTFVPEHEESSLNPPPPPPPPPHPAAKVQLDGHRQVSFCLPTHKTDGAFLKLDFQHSAHSG